MSILDADRQVKGPKMSKQLDAFRTKYGPKKGKAMFTAQKKLAHWAMRLAKAKKLPKG
jgi:hypothetical protein